LKLDLITKEIADVNIRENFAKLKRELELQQILGGYWRFFEWEIKAAGSELPIKHNLSFTPKDIIFLAVQGDRNFWFNFEQFDEKNIYVTTSGPCVLRFLAGRYAYKAYKDITSEYPVVPPASGGGGGSGTPWYTGASSPSSGLGSVGDFYLNTSTKGVYLKTGASTWTLQGDLQDNPFSTTESVFTAGAAISAVKAVYNTTPTTVVYATKTALSSSKAIGIAKNAASLGGSVTVVTSGELSDASFTFAANETLYLDINGGITNVAPTTGHRVVLGYSLGVGKIFIRIEEPIVLA